MLPFLTLISLALAFAHALVVPQEDIASHEKRTVAPLKLDFTVKKSFNESTPMLAISAKAEALNSHFSLTKRATSATLTNNRDISYLLDLKLGSDQQPITVLLDTGSSDLWVYSSSVSSAIGGTFNTSSSLDDKKTGEDFSIKYLDGSFAKGDLRLWTSLIKSSGILGVADKNQEESHPHYDNLPWALQAQGVTPKASYSLYLGSEESGKGSIIFGGIDTEKYEGELTKYPVAGTLGLALDVKSAEIGGHNITLNKQVVLDSGTSLNLWPSDLIDAVGKELGGVDLFGFWFVQCDQPKDKYLTFDFGKNKIKVSYQDLIWKSQGKCLLGVQPSQQDVYIFGDVFLRSAYVYYDLSSKEISIAQAKDSDTSNIISA
ncbi:hypothetical protein FDK38_004484 [Candidozyma auris]|nr:hypothetical protein FDK38_004484 [[Candida] auris]